MKELKTEKIFLRRLLPEDATSRYVEWLNDPEVNRFLETKYILQTQESVRDFVRAKAESESEFLFGIFLNHDGSHIGNIKLGPVNLHHKSADISLFIGEKSQWGKGLASEAIGLIVGWAFESLQLQKLRAGCYEGNTGSAKAFEKNGFRKEAVLEDQLMFEGRPVNQLLFGLSRRRFHGTES